jgi:Mpv17 / PMP22 family
MYFVHTLRLPSTWNFSCRQLWPAAQFVNFSVIPRQFQILWVNGVAFVWTILLTYISHGDRGSIEEASAKPKRKMQENAAKR